MNLSISTNGSLIETVDFLTSEPWPSDEPDFSLDCVQLCATTRKQLLEQCSRSGYFPDPEWWRKAKCTPGTVTEVVRNFLNHKVLQFNSKRLFAESGHVLQQISRAIRKENRIDIILPAFCVISSWQKRHHVTSATFAEEVSLLHLARVARTLEKNIGTSLRFLVISDATFYAGIFGDPMDAAERYIRDLDRMVQKHGIEDAVRIVDMSDVVKGHGDEYENALERNLEIFSREPGRELSEREAGRFKASVAGTLNISDLGMTYHQLREMHCAGRFPGHSIRKEIEERVSRAFIHYRAMKQSMAELEWERKTYPQALRGTIHHKTVPVVGVRIYPDYKSACQLLPYHGIAVLYQQGSRWRMRIEHEIHLHDSSYSRVAGGEGESDFYVCPMGLESSLAA